MAGFSTEILADSIGPTGDRLITYASTYWRGIHAELMTHKMLSKSSASSRAIPVAKMIQNVQENPFVPIWWGKNEPGMQAYAEVDDKEGAEAWWREGINLLVDHASKGVKLGLHKQITNRFLETGMWITVIISGTTFTNLEGLRIHPAAEPHFQKIARMMREAREASMPKVLKEGEWHLPLIHEDDRARAYEIAVEQGLSMGTPYRTARNLKPEVDILLAKASVGRCARVSYLTHDGRKDLLEDIGLHDKLMVQEPLHAAPAEHVAQAMDWPLWFKRQHLIIGEPCSSKTVNELRWDFRDKLAVNPDYQPSERELGLEAALSQIQSGNFRGFRQYRKLHRNEHIGERMP